MRGDAFADIFAPAVRAEKEGIPQWLAAAREASDLRKRAEVLENDARALRCKGTDSAGAQCTWNAGHRVPCAIREDWYEEGGMS